MLRNVGLRKSVEQPVLDLNFAASQIGSNAAPDSRIDFSRGSNAWFVDTDGLVKKSPHNLITNSETIGGTGWTNRQLGSATFTITLNHALAPNGTLTATKADFSRDNTTQYVFTEQTAGVSVTGLTQGSCYIKAASSSDVGKEVHFWQFINSVGIRNQSIATLTSEWQRFELVNTHSHTGTINEPFAIGLINNVGSELNVSVLLWGAQLSQHSTPPVDNPYLKTTGSAVYAARLDHDPTWFMSAAQEQNLFTNSEMLDETGSTGWTATRTVVTKDSTEDPNGDTTAEKILEDSTASNSHFVRSPDFTVTEGKSYTASAYVKVASGTERLLRIAFTGVDSAFSYLFAQFDLQSGTVQFANADDSSITDVGNGWFRISVTETASSTADTAEVQFAFVEKSGTASYDGDGTSGFFVWGAQVEVGTSPGTYHRTEGQPYYGEGATPKGLLIEEQRANLFQYSEEFDNAAWTTSRASVTANAVLAPDGTVTADKLVEDTTASNTHQIAETVSSLTAQPYTFSVFAKAGERDHIQLLLFTGAFGANVARADFDLTNETSSTVSGTIDNSSITAVGNGWYRVLITVTATTTGSGIGIIYLADDGNVGYTGDGSSGLYIWGAQLEAGSFPTSYIKNSGTPAGVTRNADVAVMGPTTGGTELVTNGTYDTDTTGWAVVRGATLSVSSGQLTVAGDAQFGSGAMQGFSTVAGRRYRASFDIISVSASNAARVTITNNSNDVGAGIADATSLNAGNGQTLDFTAEQATSYIVIRAQDPSTTVVYDNLSVRELYPFEQYNPAEGTLYSLSSCTGNDTHTVLSMHADSFDNYFSHTYRFGNSLRNFSKGGGSTELQTAEAVTLSNRNEIATTYDGTSMDMSANGSDETTGALGADIVGIHEIAFGLRYTANQYSGHIERVQYFPRALPKVTLQSLTSD